MKANADACGIVGGEPRGQERCDRPREDITAAALGEGGTAGLIDCEGIPLGDHGCRPLQNEGDGGVLRCKAARKRESIGLHRGGVFFDEAGKFRRVRRQDHAALCLRKAKPPLGGRQHGDRIRIRDKRCTLGCEKLIGALCGDVASTRSASDEDRGLTFA